MSQENKKIYILLQHHEDIYQALTHFFKEKNEYTILTHYDHVTDLISAQCIITDDFKLSVHSKQKLIFVPTFDENKEHYTIIQKILRLSDYNLFDNFETGLEIVDYYGLKNLLPDKNVYCSNEDFFTFDLKEEPTNLVFIDTIQNESQAKMVKNFLNTHQNVAVLSPLMKNYDFIKSINPSISYIVYMPSKYSFKQKVMMRYLYWIPQIKNKIQKNLTKNINKSLSKLHYNKIIYLFDHSQYTSSELVLCKKPIDYIMINPLYVGVKGFNKTLQLNKNYLMQKSNVINYNEDYITDVDHPETSMNQAVEFHMIRHTLKRKNGYYDLCLWIRERTLFQYPTRDLKLYLENRLVDSEIKLKSNGFIVKFKLSFNDLVNLPAQNKLYLQYINKQNIGFKKDIYFTARRFVNNEYLKSQIMNIDGKTSFYLRQSLKNRIYLTVRLHNRTDSFIENLKINIAYYISFLFKHKNVYLLYEKDSARYEESASVVYEKLIDMNYKQAYFILERSYPDINKINSKYRKHIIYKYTFKHYLYFFISRVFLGSELMVHAMELRIMNKHVLRKIYSTDIHNVFLQHGVMYMVSLDSASRKYFNPKKDGKGKFRVVTSSNEEARHFVELGGYNPEQIIVCGLPKYDRNILYPTADKIVIMPTWRVWEYNQATTDFSSTPYYKMLERIVSGIKEKYLDRLIILPHPLFYKAAMNNEFSLKKYMRFNVKYDELLRQTKVLITDYSSIAYDAFYRGSRVIFYWEELEQCLENYGENTKLMLNENNVFGDICYCKEDVSQVIDDNYDNPQKEVYKERYNHLVEFHDGKNTERLIEQLKQEKIID